MENAVRHNEPGGRVLVTVTPGRIRVENTGREIAPDDVRRLAEPFERLNRDCDGPGAGLGLSIVRAVADAHGARLDLSPRPGAGSSPRWRSDQIRCLSRGVAAGAGHSPPSGRSSTRTEWVSMVRCCAAKAER